MDQKTALTGDTLLDRIGVGTSKSYYSGRGAKLADLNGRNLVKAYTIIRDDVGQEAADEFVEVVDSIRELSACNFIDAMRRFYSNNWQFSPGVAQSGEALDEYSDLPSGESGWAAALGGLMSEMSGMRERDETGLIKHSFREELHTLKGSA